MNDVVESLNVAVATSIILYEMDEVMTKLYIGKIVNTHGIKGELRIKDNLTTKQRMKYLKIGSNLIIDDNKYLITSYRVHKDYDMVTFLGFNNINEVLFLKNKKVYKEESEINLKDEECFR